MKVVFFILFSVMFHINPVQADSHHPQVFLEEIRGSKDEGKKIVEHFCASCHAEKPLISLGAPRIGQEEWCIRVKGRTEILWKHTIEGFNAMPPRGGCFECSDEQLLLAVEAMLPKSLKEKILIELRDHKKTD